MATELKRLDFTANSFEGKSGRRYIVHNSLNTERYKVMERLQIEVGFGSDFQSLFNTLGEIEEEMNKMQFVRVAVLAHNARHGIARNLNYREHPMLLLCTLFFSAEGEDLTRWTEAEAAEKIADWAEYDVQDFFQQALRFVLGWRDAYLSVMQTSLPTEMGPETTLESAA